MYPTMVNFFSGLDKAKKSDRRAARASSDAGPELAGRESHRGDGKPAGPDRPLGKGVRGIETSGSGYLRQQIRGGRKGRAERLGLAQLHNIAKKYRPKC